LINIQTRVGSARHSGLEQSLSTISGSQGQATS